MLDYVRLKGEGATAEVTERKTGGRRREGVGGACGGGGQVLPRRAAPAAVLTPRAPVPMFPLWPAVCEFGRISFSDMVNTWAWNETACPVGGRGAGGAACLLGL